MKRRNFIAFDLGETLVNFNLKNQWRNSLRTEVIPRMYDALNQGFQLLDNFKITKEDFTDIAYSKIALRPKSEKLAAMSKRIAEILIEFRIMDSDHWDTDLINSQMNIFYDITISRVSLYPDVKPTLKALKDNNYVIGLFSDTPWQSPGRFMDDLLKRMGINQYIDYALYSGDLEKRKPDPFVFQMLIEKAKTSKNQMIYIGDREPDIMGAFHFGIPSVLINRIGKVLKKSCPPPTYEITDLTQLLDILPIE